MAERRWRKLTILAIALPMGLLALVLLLAGGLWIFRRPITISLLERVNETIPGTIIIGIGKRGRERLEDRWNRRNDRRTRREN